MKKSLKLVSLLLGAAMIFGFTGCDSPVTENIPTYYTVTFNSNGGSAVEKQIVASGSKATMPAIPTKAATPEATFTFAGWYSDAALTTAFDFETAITADLTLYAKWTATAIVQPTPEATYTVTIASGITNGTVSASKTSGIKAGETVTLTATPANGYKLGSLSVKNGDTDITVTNNTFTMPAANVTVSATFEALPPNTYSVTFNSMGGTAVTEQTVTSGNKATRPDDPTKAATTTESYAFDNWYTSTDGGTTLSATAFDFNTPITSSIVLYAKWNVTNLYSVTISATTNGTVVADKTSGIAAGETVTLTITPEARYELDSLSVTSLSSNQISGSGNTRTFTMPAQNVTVTATFKIHYIGTKLPSVAKEVGDIVFNDGSATPYTDGMTITDEQKNAAIALIFYKGTGLNSGSDTTTVRTLGVGLKHAGMAWCTSSANAYGKNIATIQCKPRASGGSLVFTDATANDRNGSDNLEQIATFLSAEGSGTTDDTATAVNYPAFYFAKNYASQTIGEETESRIASGSAYASGWYLPSLAELFQIYACRADTTNGFNVDTASAALGGDQFSTRYHWSSSQYASNGSHAYLLTFLNGDCYNFAKDVTYCIVCCIREF